ncbi:conjugative transfer signal peptidase TraF [Sphingobium sp. B11D3B]|uniref:S26 family signal peptidase n=1 Tax=Sphingobium sp. B11D3B TaxID=2940575 RepID=UPI002225E08E|nr:S26 family signal peptidase [Sphingobium sp. B11D3B]MCW2387137.1 conjugative transfer signal peptidase TraF [Sphingobium sp. B11D3B]
MTRLGYVLVTFVVAQSFIALFTAVAWFMPQPRLLWNASASAPIGLYRLYPGEKPSFGDLVAYRPSPVLAQFMAQRHYLPAGIPLLKHVAAYSGATICRRDAVVMIDGHVVAIARASDSQGRPLPVWRGCRGLRADQLFLLNDAPDSLDGRYFGPVPASGLIGRATPILTRDAPDAPLRWRLARPREAHPITHQGDVRCK